MFTTLAFGVAGLIGWLAGRENRNDVPPADDSRSQLEIARHTRQDARLIAYLLFGILIMLGVIADRLP